jgi:hypothetical protein
MNFTATALIKDIDKLNEKFFKVLLEDERRQYIVVNVPVEKEHELAVGSKVSIWGNVSAFNYQNKWYNNLFAQTVVPEEKKFLLVEKIEGQDKECIRIIQYGSEPFNLEFVKTNFPVDFKNQTDNIMLPEESHDNIENETLPKETDETISLSLFDRLLFKKNVTSQLSEKDEEGQISGFCNLEYWHLQNAISQKKVFIREDCIFTNENFSFFTKPQGLLKLPLLYFYEQGEVICIS